jgi:tetratricopeptide (TPR) repeat protein
MNVRVIIGVVLIVSACGGSSAPETPTPQPAQEPPLIPDPSAVIPDVVLPPPPRPDRQRARELVAVGRALRSQSGDHRTALNRFREAVEADSTFVDAHWEIGWSRQQLGRFEEALDAWAPVHRLQPSDRRLARYEPIVAMRRDHAKAMGPVVEEESRAGESITLTAVGDVTMGMAWPSDAARLPPSPDTLFQAVAPLIRNADIAFANLETVLADTGESAKCRPGSQSCYAFRVPTAYARALRAAGFNAVSINNNHAGDFGDAGRIATMSALDSMLIVHAGPTATAGTWETHGLQIALLAFSTGEGTYRVQDVANAVEAVRQADRTHDLVFVSFHGGAEGADATRVPRAPERAYGEDRGDVFAFARGVVDAGADLVLGHGPHVLRGMEIYRGRLIAYSLGNFSSWRNFNLRGPLGQTVVLRVTLAINGVTLAAAIDPVTLQPPGIPIPDATGQATRLVRELSQLDFGNPLFDDRGRYQRGGSPRR